MSLNDSKKKRVQVITSRGHVLATYESAREAARRTNIHHSQINHVCAKKESHAKGFVFRHAADPQAELNQLSLQELLEAKQSALDLGVDTSVEAGKGGSRQKKVQVVTSQGNRVLATYKSAAEAARRTGISRGDISNICLGNRTNAKGFFFRYADPEAELSELSLEELQEAKQSAIDLGEEVQQPLNKKRGRSSRLDASESEEEVEVKEEYVLSASCNKGAKEDEYITCSSCLVSYHSLCLEPPLPKLPTTIGATSFQCAVCATKRKRRRPL